MIIITPCIATILKVQNLSNPSKQNICIRFVQRRPNVFDVGSTCTNVIVIQLFRGYWDDPMVYLQAQV